MSEAVAVKDAAVTIEFQRASRWYGPVIALNDVSTTLGPGVTGLLGPNGAGKSTFLKLCAGQLAPSQGVVKVLGMAAWGHPELFHQVGLCPEADALWDGLTGEQFLRALLRLSGFDDAECARRAEAALETVDLVPARNRRCGGYSRGMRQRLKLAQALAHDPQVLLLDEPLTGMDPINRRRSVDLVKRLAREGRTIVVSSHILHEVESMTRRVLLIHNGRILAEGDVREIRDLMDEHPHTVALRARDPRALARAVVGAPHVVSVSFGGEGEWVTVQTARPDEFYGALADPALEAGAVLFEHERLGVERVVRALGPAGGVVPGHRAAARRGDVGLCRTGREWPRREECGCECECEDGGEEAAHGDSGRGSEGECGHSIIAARNGRGVPGATRTEAIQRATEGGTRSPPCGGVVA